jgi:glycosyltransferase involved in cell wall biosynthesis
MRVAIVHNIPIHYKDLLFRNLVSHNLDFRVVFVASQSIHRPPLDPQGYDFRFAHKGAYERCSSGGVGLAVWKELTFYQPNVVVISGWADSGAWSAWLWAELFGRPKILWSESNAFDYPRHWYKELVKAVFVRRFEAANVYGSSNLNYLIRLGMKPQQIVTKRAVVDAPSFARDTDLKASDRRILLFAGRLSPEKNLPMLLKAFARALERQADLPVTLALAGDGPDEDSLRKLAAALGIAQAVEFWGGFGSSKMRDAYHRAHALILPSTRDVWGLVVLEAMASRLPVLVSDRCGCCADLVNNSTGWSFNPFNADNIAESILRFSRADIGQLQAMGRMGEQIARSYSPEYSAQRIIETISNAFARAKRNSPEGACDTRC